MKNFLLACAFLMTGVVVAQGIEPTYEVQGNLVKATYYHDNGKVKQEGFYKDGKVHGKWISYAENGKKLSLGEYKNGQKSGKWFFWDAATLSEVDYSDSRVATVSKWEKGMVAYNKK
ncbi:membrane-binding protein [Flavobacterium amnicola]|uniref:Membrane-binding protein n=1 Tax=Flavobacterium amnicola TaxID=2506422 RepID=A0A4Q1K5T8_9FLAO|nr:membrane-binding protein [Flavobacterium amnicola]RXR20745.1 membrane-binding protein [Flavobacterium amnicola]